MSGIHLLNSRRKLADYFNERLFRKTRRDLSDLIFAQHIGIFFIDRQNLLDLHEGRSQGRESVQNFYFDKKKWKITSLNTNVIRI